MARELIHVPANTARTLIAQTMLANIVTTKPLEPLGEVALYPHQTDAVARIKTTLATYDGVILADDTGLGKTYVALAIAREYEHPLVIAPATLRDTWHTAMARAGMTAPWISIESLSHTQQHTQPTEREEPRPNLIIVDEAHHVRTPSTRRYAKLAALCATAKTLLMTATPIHNSPKDLRALLALFLGSHAYTLTTEALNELIIRRTKAHALPQHLSPLISPTRWITRTRHDPAHDTIIAALQTLPPPLPLRDANTAPTLVMRSLIHQWSSSDAALYHALRRRIARATALIAALDDGRYPTPHELRAWICTTDAVQLAFPALIASSQTRHNDIDAMKTVVHHHTQALTTILAALPYPSPSDTHRANLIRRIRHQHPNERIIAFTRYAATAIALFRHLQHDGAVATLTARGGLIATGELSRATTLQRFAPYASSVAPPPHHMDITLLLATDLLSEGVNLHDASVIIHLDLPWTAARLDQRIGRIARIGSPHQRVTVYGLRPDHRLDAILDTVKIVHTKAAISHRMIGTPPLHLPMHKDATPPRPSSIEIHERIHRLLHRWLGKADPLIPRRKPRRIHVAGTRAQTPGFIAACRIDDTPTLIASLPSGTISTATQDIARVLTLAQGSDTTAPPSAVTSALDHLIQWDTTRRAATDAGIDLGITDNTMSSQNAPLVAKRAMLRRMHATIANAPLSRRAHLANIVTNTRRALSAPLPIAAEQQIIAQALAATQADDLVNATMDTQVDTQVHTPPTSQAPRNQIESSAIQIVALLLLVVDEHH